ncbi:T9SS type A sorting domain-containing protein [Soonwooa purpurea]
MKRTLLTLALLCATFGFSQLNDGKIPNQLPEGYVVKTVQEPVFLKNLPTTNWIDYADTSWYNAAQTDFEIATAAELAALAKLVFDGNNFLGKNITLTQDVDLSTHLWSPIGYNNQKAFSGNFDGTGKTVKNVQVNRPDNGNFVGLFGQFFKAKLKNLNLDGAKIFGKDTVGAMIGNISTDSYVENCHAKNVEIVATGGNVGGFSGSILTNSEVKNCSSSGSVSGVSQIGGFTGSSWDKTKISNSYSEGSVEGEYIVGGFNGFITFAFGPNRNNEMINCYSRANVVATSFLAGGFLGYTQQNAIFKNVYSTGTVEAPQEFGGFLGAVGNTTVTNAFFDSTIAPIDGVGKFDFDVLELDITGKSTADMKTSDFKNLLNEADPEGVWSIDASINDGYPYLNTINMLAVNNNVKSISDIRIYPSMVEAELNISTDAKLLYLEIIDMSGKTLKSSSGKEIQKTMNVSSLQKGVYMINIKTDKDSKTLKFIKK